MIINSSDITLTSSYSLTRSYSMQEDLTVRKASAEAQAPEDAGEDRVSISERAMQRLAKDLDKAVRHFEKYMEKMDKNPEKAYRGAMKHLVKDLDKAADHLEQYMNKAGESKKAKPVEITIEDGDMISMVRKILAALTGKELRISMKDDESGGEDNKDGDEGNSGHDHGHDKNLRPAWDVSYSRQEMYYENEKMTFNAGGLVRTSDGREINFSLDLMMNREHMAAQEINIDVRGVAADNLIINLNGPAPSLRDTNFAIGTEIPQGEILSYLSLGGGILVLDGNNDGQVDNLTEIIGTGTGNGFGELAAYDEDGNGWIDENDSVYNTLQIYSQVSPENTAAGGLKENNVGAIYLGSVSSPFSLMNNQNQVSGTIQKSGVYLAEDGTSGMIQQLSIVV